MFVCYVKISNGVASNCGYNKVFADFSVVHLLFQVTPEEARDSWENQFNFSFRKCSHANW